MFRNDRGVALLEILVAGLVLAVGFLGMVGVATSVMHGNAFSSRLTSATTLAQEKMEELRGLGFSGLPNENVTTVQDYHTISGRPLFKRTVSTDVAHAADGLKKATVTVYWDGDNHRVVLKTLIGE